MGRVDDTPNALLKTYFRQLLPGIGNARIGDDPVYDCDDFWLRSGAIVVLRGLQGLYVRAERVHNRRMSERPVELKFSDSGVGRDIAQVADVPFNRVVGRGGWSDDGQQVDLCE